MNLHVLCTKSTKKRLVSLAPDTCKSTLVLYSFKNNCRKSFFRTKQLFSGVKALNFRQSLFYNLLFAGLHLTLRNGREHGGAINHWGKRWCRKAGMSRDPWVTATISTGCDVAR